MVTAITEAPFHPSFFHLRREGEGAGLVEAVDLVEASGAAVSEEEAVLAEEAAAVSEEEVPEAVGSRR